jgi:lactate dehydrogenase-like 2-hydroxyacid dehydrogenase
MRIGTNLGVKNFHNDMKELKEKADFIELYLPKVEETSNLFARAAWL